MKRAWHLSAKILTGFFVAAMYAMPQATVSALPGVINYIEGQVYWNGLPISQQDLGPRLHLNASDTLTTTNGKIEVLLNPGTFLRLGENAEIRMISPTLVDSQIEIIKGEAIVEVIQIVKGNQVRIVDAGASITLRNSGVYRITTQPEPAVSVYAGKAEADLNGFNKEAKKGHEILLTANLPEQRFDTKAPDELYAWSNVRSEYDAGASYAAASALSPTNNGGPGGGYYPPNYTPGWYWNGAWDSWAWLPGDGYFFSPFGWGFYSPGYVGSAPVVYTGMGGRYGRVPVSRKGPLAGSGRPRTPNSPSRATAAPTSAKALATSSHVANRGSGSFNASRSGGGRPSGNWSSGGGRPGGGRSGSGGGGGTRASSGAASHGGGFSGGGHAGGGSSGGSGGGHGGGGSSGGSSGGGHR